MTAVPSTPFHRQSERLALNELRHRLVREPETLARTKTRIEIVHLYRRLCLMKNARYELIQAFRDLSIAYPANTLSALIPTLRDAVRLWRRRRAISSEELFLRTTLYEEAGLSAYYLRDFLSMGICVVGAFLPSFLSRPTPAWTAWLGASACAFGLLKARKAVRLLHKALDRNVATLNNESISSRALMWKALAHEYLGEPSLAEKDFRNGLAHSTLSDLRLITFTLCCNLNLRGHANEIFDPPLGGSSIFPAGDALEWCTLPALAWLGREQERSDILLRARAIFCANNAEAWLIAQYSGNVLLSGYISGAWEEEHINDCIARVRMIGMRPWEIHVEASPVLVGEAYIEMTRALREGIPPSDKPDFQKALRRLSLSFPHPSSRVHEMLIRAIDAAARRNVESFSRWLERAEKGAQETNNDWVRFEVLRLRSLLSRPAEAADLLGRAESLAEHKGWRRRPPAFGLIQTLR